MNAFTRVTIGALRWEVLPAYRDLLLGPDGLRLEEWLHAGQARVIKHGPHRTVYRATLPGLDCYLKHYRMHDTRAWLRELVRPSKARMEHERALEVAARQVPTVEPLALGERRHGPGDSFLLTRTLPDVEPLGAFLETTLPGLPAARQARLRQRLAVELGRFLARLHDAGIRHNDLHANNLLLRLDGDDQPGLYLIDLHAVSLSGPLGWEASRANLVMLNRWFVMRAGRADRRRCWQAYYEARTQAPSASAGTGRPVAGAPGLCGAQTTPRTQAPSASAGAIQAPSASAGTGRPVACAPGLYAAGLQPPGIGEFRANRARELARDLERRTWQSNLHFWRSRDRRCLETNRYYRPVRAGEVVGHAVRDLDADSLASLLADPDGPFRQPGAALLKDSPSSTVAEFDVTVGGERRRAVYKRFRVTAWSDPWAALCRRPAWLRSWVFGHGLRERCLLSPRPLAVFHRRRHGLPYEGYLLQEKVPGAAELHRFVARLADLPEPERRPVLRRLIEEAARLVRELHRRRLAHRDLKASNILVAGEEPTLWLIDLVGVRRYRRLPRRRRVQNLARLHASFCRSPLLTRADRLRFLRVYLQCGLFGRERWKNWWHEVDEATKAKVARNARSGRPLA